METVKFVSKLQLDKSSAYCMKTVYTPVFRVLKIWTIVLAPGVGSSSAVTALVVVLSLTTILTEYNLIEYYPAQKP
jgi:hypothetical protein